MASRETSGKGACVWGEAAHAPVLAPAPEQPALIDHAPDDQHHTGGNAAVGDCLEYSAHAVQLRHHLRQALGAHDEGRALRRRLRM